MSRDESNDLLAALRRPVAPSGLRARALAAARRARAERVPPRCLEERLWNSRPLRLAWAGAVVVLTLVNLVPGLLPSTHGRDGEPAAAAAWHGVSDLEAALDGLGPSRPTLGEALASLDRLLCDGPKGRAKARTKGDTR